MKYRYLLIDNDNTLMDFHAAEHAALREALTEEVDYNAEVQGLDFDDLDDTPVDAE